MKSSFFTINSHWINTDSLFLNFSYVYFLCFWMHWLVLHNVRMVSPFLSAVTSNQMSYLTVFSVRLTKDLGCAYGLSYFPPFCCSQGYFSSITCLFKLLRSFPLWGTSEFSFQAQSISITFIDSLLAKQSPACAIELGSLRVCVCVCADISVELHCKKDISRLKQPCLWKISCIFVQMIWCGENKTNFVLTRDGQKMLSLFASEAWQNLLI